MDKQLAKEKIATLINEEKFQTLNSIFDFLTLCVGREDLEELKSSSEREKDQFLKTKAENEKRIKEEWAEADLMVREARFTWAEMMEVLDEAGGVITFSPVGMSTLFSRYSKDGYLICTIGSDHYHPPEREKEETLTRYRGFTYKIDSFYSSWNNRGIAKYLRERNARLTNGSIAAD